MRNYDFHELLTSTKFQQFAASILEIREKTNVKSNTIGRDGGIDIYFLDESSIGQVKNYKNKESSVISSLKKEAKRAKEINKRYIIVTSATISKQKRDILLEVFEGVLKPIDIIDKDDLNKLLNDPIYHHLEIEYLELLVPNSFVLSHYLDEIENNNIYTKTTIELNKIKEEKNYFSVNESFDEAKEKLIKDKALIISGEPGVGKSILGRMLCAYMINQNPNIEFLCVRNINELFKIYKQDKSQIYFFDDFWGDSKYNFMITNKEKEELMDFIKLIKNDPDKYLIITTREYILKDGLAKNNKMDAFCEIYKYNINLKEASDIYKFNILFNHLHQTKLSWKHLNIILKYWQNIVHNKNYNPRYIATFLENYEKYKDLDDYTFFDKFISYLNKPYDFWHQILDEQPTITILLLINIAINNTELTIQELERKYNNILNNSNLDKSFEYKELIKRMDDDFTITRKIDEKVTIDFKNPSYKDFLYDYLKDNITKYINYLYNETLEIDELINLWEILNKNFLIYKDLKQTKQIDEKLYNTLINTSVYDKYSWLITLAENTDFEFESQIKNYIILFVKDSINDIGDIMFIDENHYNIVFILLKVLQKKYDFSKYIPSLLNDVLFISDELYQIEKLKDLKEIYPITYKEFANEYKRDIKENIVYLIEGYISYFEGDLFDLEMLKIDYIPEFESKLNIKIPESLIKRIDKLIDELSKDEKYDYDIDKSYQPPKTKKEENTALINQQIDKLIGKNDYTYNVNELFKKWKTSKKVKEKISKIKENNLVNSLTNYENCLYWLCKYLENNEISENDITFLESLINYLISEMDFNDQDKKNLAIFAFFLLKNKKIIFQESDLKGAEFSFIDNKEKIINSVFITKRGDWYHFIHPIIHNFIVVSLVKRYFFDIIEIKKIINLLFADEIDWKSIDFTDYTDDYTLRLIKEMFFEKWQKEISIPTYKEFLNKINQEDKTEIAKKMLKIFKLEIYFDWIDGIIYYEEPFLYNLIKIDYDLDILKIFSLENASQELSDILYEFEEKKELFEVNKFLRKKSFIKILEDDGVVETLYNTYMKIKKEYNN